jgi:putative protease
MEERVGVVSDYFAKIGVAAVSVEKEIQVGDTLHFKGHTTDLTQKVESMQIEHQSVAVAKAGDSVGIKVSERVRKGDIVYKVLP